MTFERVDLDDKTNLDYASVLWELALYKFASRWMRKTDNVLDIACGAGHCTQWLSRVVSDGNVYGVDISKEVVEKNTEKYTEKNLHFIEANAEKYIKKGFYDVIVSADTIEHLTKNGGVNFVNNCYESLKSDGILIISTPRYREDRSENRKKVHIYEYDLETFQKLLETKFSKVIIFARNDEIIHLGYLPMAWTFVAVCLYPKR